MTTLLKLTACAALVLCGSTAAVAQADAPATSKPADAKKGKELSAKEVQQLVRQLESGKYKERNEATNKLMVAGKNAIDPVYKAGQTDDLELGARCVDILKHYYQNGDKETKAAAQEKLKKLQQSKFQSVAKWATEALGRPGIANGGLPFARNRAVARAGRFGRIGGIGRIANPRGFKREVKATENGKKIHIVEMIVPGNRQIVVKITEKVNGKEKTTEHKARTAAELRRKNKAIYELYRKHIRGARPQLVGGNNMPAIRIQIPQFPAGGGNRRVTSRTINGRRHLTVTEGNRTVRISDTNNKNIEMKVTETKNGKATTKSYKAKDVSDLKTKSAEAAKTYDQYKNFGRRNGNVFGGIFQNVPQAMLPVVPPIQIQPAGNRAAAKQRIAKAQAKLDAVIKKLQKHATQKNPDPAELKKIAEEVRQARAELRQATRNLP